MNDEKWPDGAEPSGSEAPTCPVLVAEDDPTNQDVIRRQLARLGYECDIASDGNEALKMWRECAYDLVLTDLHMPGMDGYELTAAMRGEEHRRDHRTTIIAFTANAVHGEAEKCLNAGMDGFLTKPLGMKALRAALDQLLDASGSVGAISTESLPAGSTGQLSVNAATEKSAAETTAGRAINERVLKDMFGDDPETFNEILNEFLAPARVNIEQIRAAANERSASGVAAAAHKLKSSARSVGAHRLADAAVVLEAAGETEDWQTIEGEASRLPAMMEDIERFVTGL